jgi:alpha/beta superfamily hydrolase
MSYKFDLSVSEAQSLVRPAITLGGDANPLASHRFGHPCRGHPYGLRHLAPEAFDMTERITLTTTDGVTLETRIDSPSSPQRVTVFCHPHPLHGGSMNAPLMIGVARRLNERGHTVIRFNFRGTGASSGHHDEGEAEQLDVAAAVDHARQKDLPVGLAGWSFGAATALRWLASHDETMPYAGIAPAARLLPDELPDGPKRIVLGNRDQVINGRAVQEYAVEHGIDLLITPGDHFFHGRGKKIGDLVGQGLEV